MRYTRDEIIIQGIELSSSPTLLKHDMPGGVVASDAYAIKWLQNALDMFHRKYPFSSDVQNVSMYIGANTTDMVLASDHSLYKPNDFIIDVRNGVICTINTQSYRLERKAFQSWLQFSLVNQRAVTKRPNIYTIINNRFKIAPVVSEPLLATLWYYALAPALEPDDAVNFPDEWSLIEFIRLKALEWVRSIEIGTAQVYMQKELARLRSSGLLNESEYEVMPLENNQVFIEGVGADYRNSWMGPLGTPGV